MCGSSPPKTSAPPAAPPPATPAAEIETQAETQTRNTRRRAARTGTTSLSIQRPTSTTNTSNSGLSITR